jgi:hypothetical protein
MNTTKLILIVGFVYISLVQKNNSTRNMMLLLTGLLAFCMLDLKEGYCTLPATLQDGTRAESCVEVTTAGAVVTTSTCGLPVAGNPPTCTPPTGSANACVYVPPGAGAVFSDSLNGITAAIISSLAKCTNSATEATLDPRSLKVCDATTVTQADYHLNEYDLAAGCPTTGTPVTTACTAATPATWSCDAGSAPITGTSAATGVHYQSPVGAVPNDATPAWKNSCCRVDAPAPAPPSGANVILNETLYDHYKAECEGLVEVRDDLADDYNVSEDAVSDYGGGDDSNTTLDPCKYAYGWKYCPHMDEDEGFGYWLGAACVPPNP